MTPQETIAHLQSQLDECRKERDAVNEEHGLAVTALSLANEDLEERGKIIDGLRADLELEQSAVARFDRVNLEAKLNAAETALAASQAQVGELQSTLKLIFPIAMSGRSAVTSPGDPDASANLLAAKLDEIYRIIAAASARAADPGEKA